MEKHINKVYPSVRDVTEKERVGMVKEIFSTITPRYDFLNHFLSLRRDMAWRRFAIKKMHFFKTKQLLDIAWHRRPLWMYKKNIQILLYK